MSVVRIYLDVDGVINVMPSPNTNGLWDAGQKDVPYSVLGYGDIIWKKYTLRWRKKVVEWLAEMSRRDDVEIWWLTTWNHNAVEQLDALFDIKSSGYVRWGMSPTDYNQYFKCVALQEDQEQSPGPFIWADDVATRIFNYRTPFGDREDFFAIQPIDTVGITDENLDKMEKFIQKYASN